MAFPARHFRDQLSIRENAKHTSLFRNTIRKYLRYDTSSPVHGAGTAEQAGPV
jgi:response regulator of citrate/malate metabolism